MTPEGNIGTAVFRGASGWGPFREWAVAREFSRVIVLVDRNTAIHCLPRFQNLWGAATDLLEMEAGESAKDLDTASRLWERLASLGADRNSLLIGLGGGVVTDMAGFVASTFKRGIPFAHVPTSLLGMVDAAIGGKTGIDLSFAKNLVGTFAQPGALLIDTGFLETLPEREWISGKAEMLKHGLIADPELWRELSLPGRPGEEAILRAAAIKERIVAEDPRENGLRRVLNFGHTLGHALESHALALGREIRHGEAVVAGIWMASWLSAEDGDLPAAEWERIQAVLFQASPPLDPDFADAEGCLPFVRQDKKNRAGVIRMVLLRRIGEAVRDVPVGEDRIRDALSAYRRMVGH